MKNIKIKVFLVIAFLTISAYFCNTAKAYECAPGFSGPYTVTATYTYDMGSGMFICPITVVYCCKWDNNTKTVTKEILEYYSYQSNCLSAIPNWTDFINWLHATVSAHAASNCTPMYPPCDDINNPYYQVIVTSAICNYYQNILMYQGDDVYTLKIIRCEGTSTCTSLWKVCLDYRTSPPTPVWTFVQRIGGVPGCSLTKPTLPPQGKSWEEPWITGCFFVDC